MEEKHPQFRPIFCLTGCTAVGKTESALRWAEANQAEIVNCDSLLFYRGMDIGTAKPTQAERERVPHHLIDVASPSEGMDVGRFLELAVAAIAEIQGRGRNVLVVGGSGFYLKAFFAPVVDSVTVAPEVKQGVREIMERGLAEAVAALRKLNPEGLDGLDAQNPRRVSKALERCIQSGKTLKELKEDFASERNPLLEAETRLTVLERDKEELWRRIELRVEQMLAVGLVEETRGLLEKGIESNPSAARAIGYRESIAFLKGEIDRDALLTQICANTRRLAKKQRTWFRGQLPASARFLRLTGSEPPPVSALF